jgi:hypothetical protein
MALILRRIGSTPSAHHRLEDYEVLDDGESIGRIYRGQAAARPKFAWFWSITIVEAYKARIAVRGHAITFEVAKHQLEKNLTAYRAWVDYRTWADARNQKLQP